MKQKIKRIISRIRRLHSNPFTEWETIKAEPANVAWHMKTLVYPSCLLVSAATFIGYFFTSLYSVYNYSFLFVVLKTIAIFCESYFSLIVSYLIIKELPYKMKLKIEDKNLFIIMAYSFTTFWTALFISGILADYKNLGTFLKFTGLYGIFLFRIGSDSMLKIPSAEKTKFIFVVTAIVLAVYFLINWSFGFALTAAHFPDITK
jgi:hypothetical protein